MMVRPTRHRTCWSWTEVRCPAVLSVCSRAPAYADERRRLGGVWTESLGIPILYPMWSLLISIGATSLLSCWLPAVGESVCCWCPPPRISHRVLLQVWGGGMTAVIGPASADSSTEPRPRTVCTLQPRVCDGTFTGSSLAMEGQHLVGTLPSQLALLSQLRFVRMQDNSLSGTIPLQLSRLDLKVLHLDSNRLSGMLLRCYLAGRQGWRRFQSRAIT